MEHIDFINLKRIKTLSNEGNFSTVFSCCYNGKNYAYKSFRKPSLFFRMDGDLEVKLDELSRFKLKCSLVPKYIVEKGKNRTGYLLDLATFKDLSSILDPLERYNVVLNIKKSICELHSNGIIHGDIHNGNILFIDGFVYLTDFDNCNCSTLPKEYSMVPNRTLFCSQNFIKKNGIIEELDIYLFNIITFELLSGRSIIMNSHNRINFFEVAECINKNNYGLFDKDDSKKICDSILSFSPSDYLIDTVNESDVKRYFLEKK